MLAAVRNSALGPIGDNQPCRLDETDYCAPRHAIVRGIDYLELEIRQDLIATPEQQACRAEKLGNVLADIAIWPQRLFNAEAAETGRGARRARSGLGRSPADIQ